MKWSVGLKIASMNAIAILALILIGITTYYSTNRMLTDIDLRQHTYQVKEKLQNLLTYLVDAETGERGYLLTKQEGFLEPYHLAETNIQQVFATIVSLTLDNISQQQRLNRLTPLIAKKLSIIQNVLKSNDPNQYIPEVNEGKKTMDDIRIIINQMNDNEDFLLLQRIKDSTASINNTFITIIIGTIFSATLLVLIGFVLTRNIAKPLRKMTDAATKIAAGELDDSFISLKRQDEIGILSQTFSRMSKSLREFAQAATTVSSGDLTVKIIPQSNNDMLGNALAKMVDNLRQFTIDNNEVVKLLNTSTNEIFTSVSQLVASGSETATAVSETTSTIEEVRQTSQVSSQKAKSVSDDAQLAAQISQSGKQSTKETNEGMIRIRDQMLSIAESMMLLSEQTQGISSIVETVDDLAQQSNLLSVNASIEAEKAGEQGKGFRIVAQEIKNLADQSKQATHRVREILSDVQKATSTAVLATEQGNKVAEGGVKKSEETGEAIMKLSNSVMEAAQAAIQIAASSQQQLVGLQQAATAMENIKQASTQNLDSTKQLESAAYNLKEVSVKLQELVSKYRVSIESEARKTHYYEHRLTEKEAVRNF